MLARLDEPGYLPPGPHAATLAETEAHFGRPSEFRRVQMESMHWVIEGRSVPAPRGSS